MDAAITAPSWSGHLAVPSAHQSAADLSGAAIPPVAAAPSSSSTTSSSSSSSSVSSSSTSSSSSSIHPPFVPRHVDKLLLDRLEANPWDTSAWRQLFTSLESAPIHIARVHFARALSLFPTAGRVAAAAARRELREGFVDRAEALLQEYLLTCYEPDLWLFYVELVEQTKYAPHKAAAVEAVARGDSAAASAAATAAAAGRAAVLQAFDFALTRIGHSFQSGPIWASQSRFLSEEVPADTQYLAGQARDMRRKAYRRATAAAHAAVDALWTDYCNFEKDTSQAKLAETLINNQQAEYSTASAVYKERVSLWTKVDATWLPAPPPLDSDAPIPSLSSAAHALKDSRAKYSEQVVAWRRILGYELSNPLQLAREPHTEVVRLHFRQCVGTWGRHSPEIWHDFACFEKDAGGGAPAGAAAAGSSASGSAASSSSASSSDAAASAVYASAMAALPGCATIALAAADFHELHQRHDEAESAYLSLLSSLHDIAARSEGLEGIRIAAEEAAAMASAVTGTSPSSAGKAAIAGGEIEEAVMPAAASGATPTPTSGDEYPLLAAIDSIKAHASGETSSASAPSASSSSSSSSSSTPRHPHVLLATQEDSKRAAATIPLIFVLHQRAARRMEGVAAARSVFASARKSPHCTPLIYLASAHVEYYVNRELNIARNVIEAGRKKFPKDVDYLLSAADFLTHVDDGTNMKAFFESSLKSLPASQSRPLWDRYLSYEMTSTQGGGLLAAVADVERARARAHPYLDSPDIPLISRVMHRYAPYGLTPASRVDADLLRRQPYAPFAPLVVSAAAAAHTGPASTGPLAAAAALLGKDSASLSRLRDGLYLQTPPGVSSALSHVPPHVAMRPDALSVVAAVAAGATPAAAAASVLAAAAAAAAPAPVSFSRWADAPTPAPTTISLSSTGGGVGSGSASGKGGVVQVAVPVPVPVPAQGKYVEVPPMLRPILARLPAFDPMAGPLPEVDTIIARLLAHGGGGGVAPSSSASSSSSSSAAAGEAAGSGSKHGLDRDDDDYDDDEEEDGAGASSTKRKRDE